MFYEFYEDYDYYEYIDVIENVKDNGGLENVVLSNYELELLKYFSDQELLTKYCCLHKDDANAQEWVAVCFFLGYGVKKDTDKAKQIFLETLEKIKNSEPYFLGDKNPSQYNINCHIKYIFCAMGLIAYYEKKYGEAYDYLKLSIDISFAKYIIARMNDKGYIYDSIIDSSKLYTEFFYLEYIENSFHLTNEHFGWFISLLQEIDIYASDFGHEDQEMAFLKNNYKSFFCSKAASGDLDSIVAMIKYCYYYAHSVSSEYEKLYIKALSSNLNDIENLETLGYIFLFGHTNIIDFIFPFSETDYQNIELSYKYYMKAAKLGSAKAQYYLSCFYMHGIFVDKDAEIAISYLKQATENGNAEAQYCLGVCYKLGCNINIDLLKANELFALSANQNYGLAQFEYAKMLEMGFGKEQNQELAIEYYKKASLSGVDKAYDKLEKLISNPESYFSLLSIDDAIPFFFSSTDEIYELIKKNDAKSF